MKIIKDCMHTQAKNCKVCLHIGSTALLLGKGKKLMHLEMFTPMRRFRVYFG